MTDTVKEEGALSAEMELSDFDKLLDNLKMILL